MFAPIQDIIVLGGGSAGLLAALTLKRRIPSLSVRVLRSSDIGVIGVGEGTTAAFPPYLLHELRLDPARLYAEAEPIWKLGIRFLWGARPEFFYTFSAQFNFRWPDLPRNNGFYCDGDAADLDVWSALMRRGKAFPRRRDGQPDFARHQHVGFHIENRKLVSYLEARCRELGVAFVDATLRETETGAQGVTALILENGERLSADLYVDASGFRSELIGRALGAQFLSYEKSLFCDRAVIGGWPRTDEPIHPYTTCETMDAGWAWQIEHEHWINRGYVYSSRFIDDDAAREEFLKKNPKVAGEPRVVKFRTGRYDRLWIGNVVGIGNASGFVEPLEATALATIITQCRALTDILIESALEPTPGMQRLYNQFIADAWDEIRDFITVHYAFNMRINTPFWRACRADTELGAAAGVVEFYRENGPTSIGSPVLLRASNAFGMEGYLAMLVGQKVPHRKTPAIGAGEWEAWNRHRQQTGAIAQNGVGVIEMLDRLRGRNPVRS